MQDQITISDFISHMIDTDESYQLASHDRFSYSIGVDVPDHVLVDAIDLQKAFFTTFMHTLKKKDCKYLKLYVQLVYGEVSALLSFRFCPVWQDSANTNWVDQIAKGVADINTEFTFQQSTDLGECCALSVPFALPETDGQEVNVMTHTDSNLSAEQILKETAIDQILPDDLSAEIPHLSILMAEDNEINQRFFKVIFDLHGHSLDIVSNGKEAVDAMKTADINKYDLILMDINMPIMGGREATKVIRKMTGPKGHIPILALTSHTRDSVAPFVKGLEINGIVEKPFKEEEFNKVIYSIKADLQEWRQLS